MFLIEAMLTMLLRSLMTYPVTVSFRFEFRVLVLCVPLVWQNCLNVRVVDLRPTLTFLLLMSTLTAFVFVLGVMLNAMAAFVLEHPVVPRMTMCRVRPMSVMLMGVL